MQYMFFNYYIIHVTRRLIKDRKKKKKSKLNKQLGLEFNECLLGK